MGEFSAPGVRFARHYDQFVDDCEARMHAVLNEQSNRFHVVALAFLAVGFSAGCRGTLTHDRGVQVDSHPNTDDVAIDPPEQRLSSGNRVEELVRRSSTSRNSVGQLRSERPRPIQRVDDRPQFDDRTRETTVHSDDSPQESARYSLDAQPEHNSSQQPTAAVRDSRRSISHDHAPIELSFGDSEIDQIADDLMKRAGVQRSPKQDSAQEVNVDTPTRDDLARQLKTLPHNQQAEIVAGFKSDSPKQQRMALDQLIAIAQQNARPSSQPASIDALLQNALTDMPTLPPRRSDGNEPFVYPTRLASNETIEQMQDRLDAARRSARWASDSAEKESYLASTSESNHNIRQVSSQEETHDDASIREQFQSAGHIRPVPGNRSENPSAVETAVAQVSAALLSDEALYRMLLQRTMTPVEGESKADAQRREIVARHLMVLSGDPDSAVDSIKGLTEKEQEYLRHQLLALWTVIDPDGHPVPGRRFSAALPQLREAAKYLAAATDSLDVTALAFCTEVESYGQIREFESMEFLAGQQVIMYCEIDNFTVDRKDGQFETHLQGSYDIYDADNRKVVSQLLPTEKQLSRNYLRDYFTAYQMYLPKKLPKGDYRLQLTMEDVNGQKYGQSNLSFTIKK